MAVLMRYCQTLDGTIPISALLYEDEHLLASQDSVGLYDGPNKSAHHQSGTVHVTSQRLFFIAGASSSSPIHAPPPSAERGASLVLSLNIVTHTESYAGFFTSSPKVTLYLSTPKRNVGREQGSNSDLVAPTPTLAVGDTSGGVRVGVPSPLSDSPAPAPPVHSDNTFDTWECEICGYRNPPGLSPAARNACGLCGMPRSVSTSATPSSSTPRSSSTVNTDSPPSRLSPVPISSSRNATSTLSANPTLFHSRSLPSSIINASASPFIPSALQAGASPPREVSHGSDGGENAGGSHRPSTTSCSACTFLNHPYMRECEICGTPLSSTELERKQESNSGLQPTHFASKSAPTSRPVSPAFEQGSSDNDPSIDIDEKARYIKLSFRKGGDKAFYAALKTALQQKEWEAHDAGWSPSGSGREASVGLSGISGILQTINSSALHTERGMSDAFADLEALMSKAQDMVRLAKGLNEQLSAAVRNPSSMAEPLEPEEATFVRSSLGQLGLGMKNTAVTADMSSDERKYLEQLAIELAGVLEGDEGSRIGEGRGGKVGIMRDRGIVGLDEVWGGWNRARGVALISPEITLKALSYLPLHTTPAITTRTLASGLRVLHTPAYTPSAFAARLAALLVDSRPLTMTEIAGMEALSVGLIDELVKEVEERGDICRDDPQAGISGGVGAGVEVRWWTNAFNDYSWDGQDD